MSWNRTDFIEITNNDIAKQLFDMGYTVLFLATGHHSGDFPVMPWIKAIVGKKPPF